MAPLKERDIIKANFYNCKISSIGNKFRPVNEVARIFRVQGIQILSYTNILVQEIEAACAKFSGMP